MPQNVEQKGAKRPARQGPSAPLSTDRPIGTDGGIVDTPAPAATDTTTIERTVKGFTKVLSTTSAFKGMGDKAREQVVEASGDALEKQLTHEDVVDGPPQNGVEGPGSKDPEDILRVGEGGVEGPNGLIPVGPEQTGVEGSPVGDPDEVVIMLGDPGRIDKATAEDIVDQFAAAVIARMKEESSDAPPGMDRPSGIPSRSPEAPGASAPHGEQIIFLTDGFPSHRAIDHAERGGKSLGITSPEQPSSIGHTDAPYIAEPAYEDANLVAPDTQDMTPEEQKQLWRLRRGQDREGMDDL